MLNRKEKHTTFTEQGAVALHVLLKGFSWCMCLASVLLLLLGILFLLTGDQNIFLHKRQLQSNQQPNNGLFLLLYDKNDTRGHPPTV